jgi:hypothetical protein
MEGRRIRRKEDLNGGGPRILREEDTKGGGGGKRHKLQSHLASVRLSGDDVSNCCKMTKW